MISFFIHKTRFSHACLFLSLFHWNLNETTCQKKNCDKALAVWKRCRVSLCLQGLVPLCFTTLTTVCPCCDCPVPALSSRGCEAPGHPLKAGRDRAPPGPRVQSLLFLLWYHLRLQGTHRPLQRHVNLPNRNWGLFPKVTTRVTFRVTAQHPSHFLS